MRKTHADVGGEVELRVTVRADGSVHLGPKRTFGSLGVYHQPPRREECDCLDVDDEVLDPVLLYREQVARVVWQNESRVVDCGRSRVPVTVRWVIATSGLVATVLVLTEVDVKQKECIERNIIRWKFPELPREVHAWPVRHVFDPELATPLRASPGN